MIAKRRLNHASKLVETLFGPHCRQYSDCRLGMYSMGITKTKIDDSDGWSF